MTEIEKIILMFIEDDKDKEYDKAFFDNYAYANIPFYSSFYSSEEIVLFQLSDDNHNFSAGHLVTRYIHLGLKEEDVIEYIKKKGYEPTFLEYRRFCFVFTDEELFSLRLKIPENSKSIIL